MQGVAPHSSRIMPLAVKLEEELKKARSMYCDGALVAASLENIATLAWILMVQVGRTQLVPK